MKTLYVASLLTLSVVLSASAQTRLTGKLLVWPQWTYSSTNPVSPALLTEIVGKQVDVVHTSGTNGTATAPQMDSLCRVYGTLTNGQTAVHDLTACTNSFGTVLHFVRVNYISLKAGSTSSFSLGGNSVNAFASPFGDAADKIRVKTNGMVFIYAPDSLGYPVGTNGMVLVSNDTHEADALFVPAYIGIDATASKFATTNEASYAVGGLFKTKAATTGLSFSAAGTINVATSSAALFGVWSIQIDGTGTITTKAPATNQTYTSAALAAAAAPAADTGNIRLGYVVVSAVASNTWTAGTSELTGVSTFVDDATSSPTVAGYELIFGGVAQ